LGLPSLDGKADQKIVPPRLRLPCWKGLGADSEEAIFDTLVKRKTIDPTKVKIIATSAPIPNYPIVMQGRLTPQLKDEIREAFLEMKDPKILKSFRAEGFAATDDKAYDVLRDTAKILQLDLDKMS
jgi:phosphonate transport system substrate-binding protein